MNWQNLINNNRLRQSKRRNKEDARNDFESDFGRIIFSPALRRMHDKTQVFPLTTDDNIHSRLTHSMEVMSVGYSLAVRLCESDLLKQRLNKTDYELFREIPTILKNCCLIHDIGNPPFGHFGETVIQNYFKDLFRRNPVKQTNQEFSKEELSGDKLCLKLDEKQVADFTEFDGNAQGLRVLTKLQILNDAFGLNLTYATLGCYIKYPNCDTVDENGCIEITKRGVFQSEKKYFEEIVRECGLIVNEKIVRHPLCYLMEAADSICYLTMDIEDGFNKGLYDLDYLYNIYKDIPSISKRVNELYNDEGGIYKNDITKMVNFRIEIIQNLALLTIRNFETNIDKIESGEYSNELIFDDKDGLAQKLKDICSNKIFKYRDIISLEITGHSVITGLLDHYINFIFHKDKKYRKRAQSLISESLFKAAFLENNLPEDAKIDALDDYYKLRIIVDFVSGMTDQFALNHYQKISGQKIN